MPWTGPDASAFRARFESGALPAGQRAVALLAYQEAQLEDEAQAQDAASSAEGDTVGVTTPREDSERGGGDGQRDLGETGRLADPRSDRRPSPEVEQETGAPEHGTAGPRPYENGLGEPVPGTSAQAPDVPEWTPPDEGSGEYDVRDPGLSDYANYELAEAIAAGGELTGKGPAAENMRHFLGNTGEDKPIDVDDMLGQAPDLRANVEATEQQLGMQAIENAKKSGVTGPVTFPVNTPWTDHYIGAGESEKYYYATGGMKYNVNGTVTAYPPDTPGGEWRYEMKTSVNTRDRYNWDAGKTAQVGPITVSDEQMQGLHQSGLAQDSTSSAGRRSGRGADREKG